MREIKIVYKITWWHHQVSAMERYARDSHYLQLTNIEKELGLGYKLILLKTVLY